MTEHNDHDMQERLDARFKELPKVVQDAILSADMEKHLRELAGTHKLHLDQWASLENEVMYTMLGFEPIERLAENVEKNVGTTHETALQLTEDISRIVFAPVRQELERVLAEHQKDPGFSDAVLAQTIPAVAPVAPGTPPSPPPEGKAIRAPISASYAARQPSTERKIVEGDPYREPAV